MNKKQLAIILSKLETFSRPNVELEQYQTNSEIAADALWFAYMNRDITGKSVLDLGCGSGIFGLGALVLGAKKATFVEIDRPTIEMAKRNKKTLEKAVGKKFNAVFLNKNVTDFRGEADVAVQNPPFGVQKTHKDKLFLIKAMESASIVYSFHKISTKDFIERLAKDNGFKVKNLIMYKFPLEKKLWFHTREVYYVDVGFWKLYREKQKNLKKGRKF